MSRCLETQRKHLAGLPLYLLKYLHPAATNTLTRQIKICALSEFGTGVTLYFAKLVYSQPLLMLCIWHVISTCSYTFGLHNSLCSSPGERLVILQHFPWATLYPCLVNSQQLSFFICFLSLCLFYVV